MKKLSGLLFLSLSIGLGNLSAQTPMQRDSMRSGKNKMQPDTSRRAPNNMRRDSTINPNNSMNQQDNGAMGNSMKKESMMTNSKNNMGDGNIMATHSEMKTDNRAMSTPNVTNWPEASRMAVDEITSKYGKPDGVTADELFWLNKGVWKKICITKMESKHSFPIEHTDMMQTTISYDVPEDKMDDLGKFDGSVTFDRTQGTMSARCDKEANNFLALNLANDIIIGKKTVEQARKAYGDIVKAKMKGGNPAYMAKLSFDIKSNTADPDKNTTGLTKEDVMKAMTQK